MMIEHTVHIHSNTTRAVITRSSKSIDDITGDVKTKFIPSVACFIIIYSCSAISSGFDSNISQIYSISSTTVLVMCSFLILKNISFKTITIIKANEMKSRIIRKKSAIELNKNIHFIRSTRVTSLIYLFAESYLGFFKNAIPL